MIRKVYLILLKKINRKKYAEVTYEDRIRKLKKLGVKIGDNCRIENAKFGSEPYLIEIGEHVTIGANVQFVTHDGGVWVLRDKYPDIDVFGRIIIEDNCFIGINSIIMPNVKIGKNSIVAAGSIVTRDISPNTVVAGVPAKKIKSIEEYEKKVIEKSYNTKNMSYINKKKFLINEVLEKRI